ncbi:MAG: complex I NDUFA9 subunit family protein [Alphaproteobacteria bacterium]|nr:complex I NDUFA9 subunit family protein [Alphaproteobacteria bacterium]
MSRIGEDKLATVFGASGFVGRAIVAKLAKRGWRIRAACRRPDLAGYLQPMGTVGQIHPVQANLRYPNSIHAAVAGADLVVNAVGILAPTGKQTFRAIHAKAAGDVARISAEAGVARLVHISAIGASTTSRARYARSKAEGEAAVLQAFPNAIVLRPSIVFGAEDEFFNRFAAMARISPVLPLIGRGRTKFQPVYVGDIGEAVGNIAEGSGEAGLVYELGGPEQFTFRQLLDLTQTWAGRDRAYLNLPFWVAKLQAALTWPLPNSIRPLTVDQVRLLKSDNIVSDDARSDGRTLAGLGVANPTAVSAIVPDYLERFRPKGYFAHYRG